MRISQRGVDFACPQHLGVSYSFLLDTDTARRGVLEAKLWQKVKSRIRMSELLSFPTTAIHSKGSAIATVQNYRRGPLARLTASGVYTA